ncbi:MAG: copper chaperone PCu(A)C [Rubrivivax sp.]|nr:copper chaperone PCu(A)C [Rubrivivax sp.]MDH5339113.1 copper chaperone PCu(A)C [Rubrivivax sp.]
MKFSTITAAAALLVLLAGPAAAQTTVADAWVRGTVAQQKASGMFAKITSVGGGRLVSVSTPVAGVVEIHEMSMEGNTMRMRALPNGLPLPAGQTVSLQPGGYHVMLMDLKQTLNAGDQVPVTLLVEANDGKRETLQIQVPVRALGSPMPMEPAHPMK